MAQANSTAGLTDTDVLIDATRKVFEAVAFLTVQQAASGVRISIISAMELVVGCRNKAELARVQQFLRRVVVLPVSSLASQTAHQLMESFLRKKASSKKGEATTNNDAEL